MKALILIPNNDFDPTEVAIPWSILSKGGVEVSFATPNAAMGIADQRMLTGNGLGVFKRSLMASKNTREHYHALQEDRLFKCPLNYRSIQPDAYDVLILPGGHAQGMKPYLESKILQEIVAYFFDSDRPVGAICHGVVLAARSQSLKTEKSVLFGKKTTGLPKWMELSAWHMTRLWLGDYYRTYRELTVQDEVTAVLENASDFVLGPLSLKKDSLNKLNNGFVVQDGQFLSARWPGDAHLFGSTLLKMIKKKA